MFTEDHRRKYMEKGGKSYSSKPLPIGYRIERLKK